MSKNLYRFLNYRNWVALKTGLFALFLLGNSCIIQAQKIFAISGNDLVSFETADLSVLSSQETMTGLGEGFVMAGIDFRPANGKLYGLGYKTNTGEAALYSINTGTASITQIGNTIQLTPGMGAVGFDFNPTVDRIRVTGSNGSNYRINPNSGGITATDGNHAFASGDINQSNTPNVGSVAYSNSYIGSGTTTLYVYDDLLNVFMIQSPPNAGTLNTIGNSGIIQNTGDLSSDMDIYFDPVSGNNLAYMTANEGQNESLYIVDLNTGATTEMGTIAGGMSISDMSVFIDRQDPGPLVGHLIYALTANNNLITFDSKEPQYIRTSMTTSGMASGQSLAGMDVRPATGELYAFGYNNTNGESQVYKLDAATAVMTPVGSAITLAAGMGRISFDFNPTVDRIRVTGSNGSNYRIHPGTGAIAATDSNLNYAMGDSNAGATPSIGAAAYTNSYIGASGTTLYNYDEVLNIVTTQNPPNNGTLNTVGSSGINVSLVDHSSDMDIYYDSASAGNIAYFVANENVNDQLYTMNLQTGAATQVGSIGFGIAVTDIAVFIKTQFPASVEGQLVYALSANNNLLTFDSKNPGIVRSSKAISGMVAGQVLSGMDFRPSTGGLYGMGYNNTTGEAQLYTIDTASAGVTKVGSGIILVAGMGKIGFDFNPTVDRIRVVGHNGSNYRIHPVTGAIAATDGNLAFASGDENVGKPTHISAVGYTNSYFGASNTTLYNIDDSLNILTSQNPPNNGILNTIGITGITQNLADASSDLDIFYDTTTQGDIAYYVANTGTQDFLYSLNLQTGSATSLGQIGNGIAINDIAILINRQALNPLTGQLVYALSTNGNLLTFDSDNPQIIRSLVAVSGMTGGQVLAGMDFRPSTGELYGLGYNASTGETQVYTINVTSGVMTTVGNSIALAQGMTQLGVDFNPVVDRIRVTSSGGQNYRLHPVTGALAFTDLNLNYASGDANANQVPNIVAGAYANNYNTSTGTTLFNYDASLNILTTQNPPNDGILNTVGSSGIVVNTNDTSIDMDIFTAFPGAENQGFLVANTGSNYFDHFYMIDLADGSTQNLGTIGMGIGILNIAVKPDSIYTLANKEISEIGQEYFEANPNPAVNEVRFSTEFAQSGNLSLEFFDLNGKSLRKYSYSNASQQKELKVDISELANGIYFVVFSADGNYLGRSKFIKQN